MYLLEKEDYHNLDSLVTDSDPESVHEVIQQLKDEKIFVDCIEHPTAYFIQHSSGGYYIGGTPSNPQFLSSLVTYLNDSGNHKVYYDLFASSVSWIDRLEHELAANKHIVRVGRKTYEYKTQYRNGRIAITELPYGFELRPMDESLYQQYITKIDHSYSRTFSSPKDFVTRSFGFCIVYQQKIVSSCNAYHITDQTAEVDVRTDPDFRRKGFALIVVDAFVDYCNQLHLRAIWDADKGNRPSQQLAQKCGFELISEENQLWWHEDMHQIEQYLKKYGYLDE